MTMLIVPVKKVKRARVMAETVRIRIPAEVLGEDVMRATGPTKPLAYIIADLLVLSTEIWAAQTERPNMAIEITKLIRAILVSRDAFRKSVAKASPTVGARRKAARVTMAVSTVTVPILGNGTASTSGGR